MLPSLIVTFAIAYIAYRIILTDEKTSARACPHCQQIDAPIDVIARTELHKDTHHWHEQVPIHKGCSNCNGTGSIEIFEPDQATHILYNQSCRECFGTGKVIAGYKETRHSETHQIYRFDYHCTACEHDWHEDGKHASYRLREQDLNDNTTLHPKITASIIIFPIWLICAYLIFDDPRLFHGGWGVLVSLFALIVSTFIWIIVGRALAYCYHFFAVIFNLLPFKFKLKPLW